MTFSRSSHCSRLLTASFGFAFAFGVMETSAQTASAQVGEVETQRVTRKESTANPFSALVVPDPFYVQLTSSYAHTTNAFSDFREQEDWLLDTNLAAGWRTTIGSSLYFDLAFVSNRTDYANQEALSRNMLGTRAMLGGLAFGKLPFFLAYNGNWFYDSSYDSTSLNFHTLSTVVPFVRKNLGKVNLTVASTLNWIKAQPSDFDQINPGLSMRFSLPVTGKDRLDLSLMQSYAYFQHFTPGQFTEDRQDWRSTAGIQLVHTFTKQLQLTLGVSYMRNDSNLTGFSAGGRSGGIYDFKTWNFTPTLGVNYSF